MSNNNWKTPPEIFAYFDAEYNFKCDVAADENNHLCDKYITEEMDTLKTDWLSFGVMPGEYVWLNPPYSRPLPFVKKAIDESYFNGIGSVLLLNNDMSVEWSYLLTIIGCKHIVFTACGNKKAKTYHGGRMAFLNEQDSPVSLNPKGQIAFIIPPFVRYGQSPTVKYLPLITAMNIGRNEIETAESAG
ncbi:DNA N-6-adenine-methyltransferase [Glaciecola siphonariae]|uniref:DNA N-6-adenine-methyltransferase n=1 Tax=Glaciecola siphonariae TaxID=521012 RepID=A0ABV9LS75_9ALTE